MDFEPMTNDFCRNSRDKKGYMLSALLGKKKGP